MKTRIKQSLLVVLFSALVAPSVFAGPTATVSYEYDIYGNCTAITTKTTGAADVDALERTKFTYDDYRRPTSMEESAQNSANLPESQKRKWTWVYDRYVGLQGYDPYAHTSKQWRLQYEPAYNAAGQRKTTDRRFDANDRIVEEYTGQGSDFESHYFSYDENGQKKSYTDPRNRVTDYVYDNRNRLQDTIEPKRADQATRPTTTTLYDFAGNKTKVTFPDGSFQRWEIYDAFGQPRRFLDERDNLTELNYWPYGPMKKLQTVTTHRTKDDMTMEDQVTTFYYDGMGRLRTTDFPDHSQEWTLYRFGQPENFVTRKGQWKTMHYDARGRETCSSWEGAAAAPAISRVWDDANRAETLYNVYSSIHYEYDDAGLVKSEQNTITGSGGPRVTNYTRYPDGNVSDVEYPDGISIHRDYTSRGQLKSVSDHRTAAPTIEYTYLADGKVDHTVSADNTRTDYLYDDRGFNRSIQTSKSSGQELWKRDYYRDNRDRITAFQKGSNNPANPMEDGRGDHYWYDPEGELTDAYYGAIDPVNNPNSQVRQDHFVYDQLGNRKGSNLLASRGSVPFVRDDNGLNQYSAWGASPVQHDDDIAGWGSPAHANGVLMFEGEITAGYNALNQPMYINTPSAGWVSFGYDPLGRCVKRWAGLAADATTNPATYFYYDGWNLIQEGASATSPSRNYIHGARVDEIVKQIRTTDWWERYFHYDVNGNCAFQTDASGNIVEQYYYDAFGKPYFFDAAGTNVGSSSWGNRFLFTGREYLSELKLYDYRSRLYQPELGRFMQPDPKQFAAGDYNLYRYCHNDPVNKSDPTGQDASIFQWVSTAGPIELTQSGNWGDKTAPGFYQSGLVADGKPAAAVTNAAIVSNAPQDNGGVKVNVKVDVKVDPAVKDSEIEKVEMDHPNGFKDALIGGKGQPSLNSKVQTMMLTSKQSYNSMKEYAAGRARAIEQIFKAEKARQERWHFQNGRHDLNGKFFGK